MAEEVILRFNEVTFEYQAKKPLLYEASFSVRKGAKITLMGQNGAGKSTLFNLIRGEITPQSGRISITREASVGSARQTVKREEQELSIEEYLSKVFTPVPKNIKSKIAKALEAVNLKIETDRKVGSLSGGQQARLLLSYAIIQDPDILLLDEPTNNLDKEGIDSLISFLVMYEKTVLVISHDADFLNCFTDGVIYLDSFTKKLESYVGDYYSVIEEIEKRIEREQMKNAQLEKRIKDRKEKVNFFANKGGKMRKLAKKLKDETEDLEDSMVDVRREDKTIRKFEIISQEVVGDIVKINNVKIIKNHEASYKEVDVSVRKGECLHIVGPNGIGKSSLLRALVSGKEEGMKILPEVKVGYYSQDFSTLDYSKTVFDSLEEVKNGELDLVDMRSIAAGFLITGDLMGHRVADLSEGQKGLLSFARLVLMRPGLLILDEPTNHINFRHIPIIAQAINDYKGAIILVSHMADFLEVVHVDQELDLGK